MLNLKIQQIGTDKESAPITHFKRCESESRKTAVANNCKAYLMTGKTSKLYSVPGAYEDQTDRVKITQ